VKPAEVCDLHIHTKYSDGYSTPIEAIQKALTQNLKRICITDHYSNSKPALGRIDELEIYQRDIKALGKKFSDQIQVSVGLEVDLASVDSLEDLKSFSWDLILFEYVFAESRWENSLKKVIKFKQSCKSRCNVGLAHTRFSRVTHSKFEKVMSSIRENDIIIELNTRYQNYLDPWFNYLDDQYWYSIGSDAHSLESIGNVNGALSFLYDRNIPINRIIQL
jgi:histidinol phosphatase-like PHP family hydrolase